MSNTQTKEKPEKDKKVRVFELAKQLSVTSKDLVTCAQSLGFAGITGQLNGLEPEQVEAIRDRVKKGPTSAPGSVAPAPLKPGGLPPAATLVPKIQTIPKAKPVVRPFAEVPAPPIALATPAASIPAHAPVITPHTTAPNVAAEAKPTHIVAESQPTAPKPAPAVPVRAPAPTAVTAPVEPPAKQSPPQNVIPTLGGMRNLPGRMQNLSGGRPAAPPSKSPATAAPTAVTPAVSPPAAPPIPEVVSPVVTEVIEATLPDAPVPVAEPTQETQPETPPVTVVAATVPTVSKPGSQIKPLTPNTPALPPLAPRVPPLNVIPAMSGTQGRPDVLKRAPTPPPPSMIAGRRTGTGAAPPGATPRRDGPPGNNPPGAGPRSGPPGSTQPGSGITQRPGITGAKTPITGGKPTAAGTPMKLTPEMIARLRNASAQGQKLTLNDITRPVAPGTVPTPGTGSGPGGPGRQMESRSGSGSASRIAGRPQVFEPVGTDGSTPGGDDDGQKKKAGGGVIGRDSRHRGRQGSGRGPGGGQTTVVLGPNGQVDMVEQQWGSRRGPRAALMRKHLRGKVQPPIIKEGKIEIALPITVRTLSETIGMKVGDLTKRLLKETSQLYGNNSVLEFDIAALIAVEKNIELVVKKQDTLEDQLLREYEKLLTDVDEEKLRPRPPIVTIMGHVDHGKTSLLDKIRQNYGVDSDVVSTEAGGITQVIRAWSVKREVLIDKEIDGVVQEVLEDRFITFLDTPGHEAFTKMRARGANVTDIAVIVVAATDGVRPQTQEAINHAKAAEVKIVVAINKIDMPNADVERTKRQLYNEGLIPDDMGGDVQFIQTSAVTGEGISDLLDTIVLVAEVEELTADPDRRAAGTCLEAYMTGDEGVMATVLVQQGTLKKGDIVLCGSSYGRVRFMTNDVGRAVKEAGPSTPVRISGLDRVPNADDPFYVVKELTEAQEIANDRLQKEREAGLVKFGPKSLDSIKESNARAKVTELKIIVKAEARGSIEAIKKELEKLVHDEVRVRLLHAGIGAITESDVILALTSPADTLVIGFNVTADDAALRLAGEHGITISEYDIIFKLTEDVKAALEGRLKPTEEVVHLGRAVIRKAIRISKVGMVAGCFVTSGTFERSARVRIIRGGVVVFPPGEKVVGLDSLKREKDDVKEVREGFECGMKISGYDDIKEGDVIEAFKIDIRARTL